MNKIEWTEDLSSLVNRNNSEMKALLKDLAARGLGFQARLSGKNHVIMKHPNVPMCTAAFSLTPSDKRAYKNKKADIEKMIAQVLQAGQTGVSTTTRK